MSGLCNVELQGSEKHCLKESSNIRYLVIRVLRNSHIIFLECNLMKTFSIPIKWVTLFNRVIQKFVFFSGGTNIVYCPIGYIDVNSSTVRTCLRLELMTKQYNDAAMSCQSEGGDLIRIDSAEKYAIFQQFIDSKLS